MELSIISGALYVDEELADMVVPRPDVGEFSLKFFDANLGQTLRSIFSPITDVQIAVGDVVQVCGYF